MCDRDLGYIGTYEHSSSSSSCGADTDSGYTLNEEGVAECNTNLGLTFDSATNQCVCDTNKGLTSVDNQCKCDTGIVGIDDATSIVGLILKVVKYASL